MIQIDMEMPEKCGLCPLFHAEHPMHCQGVKADCKKKIVAPYGQPRPDWCPLHEVTADPDTVSRPIGYWMRMSDLNESEDDRYKCSCCGNVVHHRDKVFLYTYNSFCGACGANNNAKNYAAYMQGGAPQ